MKAKDNLPNEVDKAETPSKSEDNAYYKRLLVEKQDLDGKIQKLESFLNSERSESVSRKELFQMRWQLNFMNGYSGALNARINLITNRLNTK